jgi:hypothetical protein
MPRKKQQDQETLLSHNLIIRVSKPIYERLDKIHKESDCQSIAEVARKILSNKKIKCFYIDISMNAPMEELVSIRKEIKAIGVNINQITRSFNQEKSAEINRAFYVMKVADLYKKVDLKVDRLLVLIAKLTEKWLQK